MTLDNLIALAGFVLALVVHGIILSGKLSQFMTESKLDREHIKESLEGCKISMRDMAQSCKTCYVKEDIERIDGLQQQLRRELPLDLQVIRDELKSLKESQARVEAKLGEIETKLNRRRENTAQ